MWLNKAPGKDRSVSEEGQNCFEVEQVIRKREEGNEIEYLLKWKGFDRQQNTWETVTSIQNFSYTSFREESVEAHRAAIQKILDHGLKLYQTNRRRQPELNVSEEGEEHSELLTNPNNVHLRRGTRIRTPKLLFDPNKYDVFPSSTASRRHSETEENSGKKQNIATATATTRRASSGAPPRRFITSLSNSSAGTPSKTVSRRRQERPNSTRAYPNEKLRMHAASDCAKSTLKSRSRRQGLRETRRSPRLKIKRSNNDDHESPIVTTVVTRNMRRELGLGDDYFSQLVCGPTKMEPVYKKRLNKANGPWTLDKAEVIEISPVKDISELKNSVQVVKIEELTTNLDPLVPVMIQKASFHSFIDAENETKFNDAFAVVDTLMAVELKNTEEFADDDGLNLNLAIIEQEEHMGENRIDELASYVLNDDCDLSNLNELLNN